MDNYIIDFDSTLVTVEGLEELAKICGADTAEIGRITRLGMEGKIGFDESLKKRLGLISPSKKQLEELIEKMLEWISPSALSCRQFFETNRIYVITGGFEEWVLPVAKRLGISEERVRANKFMFDGEGKYVGVEPRDLTTRDGKVKEVRKLRLSGKTITIGDGYTDYQIKEAGAASEFWVFTETVYREGVVKLADRKVNSFWELV